MLNITKEQITIEIQQRQSQQNKKLGGAKHGE
jgi:hypothetical protein